MINVLVATGQKKLGRMPIYLYARVILKVPRCNSTSNDTNPVVFQVTLRSLQLLCIYLLSISTLSDRDATRSTGRLLLKRRVVESLHWHAQETGDCPHAYRELTVTRIYIKIRVLSTGHPTMINR